MYRSGVVSLRSKLLRLELGMPAPGGSRGGSGAELDLPAGEETGGGEASGTGTVTGEQRNEGRRAKLEELRARMGALLARKAVRARLPAVDTPDLPFVCEQTPLGPLHVFTRRLSPAHRTGRASLLAARTSSPELLALLALDPSLAGCDPAGALYLDTETTGLHGGTGTIAFLVGLAYWEGSGGLVVEQLLVRNLGEEGPMLARVAERIRAASMVVTFNGKSFDLPLLRTRFVMGRQPLHPSHEPPHLDLVHIARRLHKPRGIDCRLTSLEQQILGFARHDDVPSGEVSACYLHFLRTGMTRPLLGVIEHNAWDVVAMAALVGLYGEPLEGSQLEADDLAGVARTLLRAGHGERAFEVASRAVDRGGGEVSLRARAEIAKARGDRQRALRDFEALFAHQQDQGSDDARVRLELAKLYEHYVKEPRLALAMVQRGTSEKAAPASVRTRRLERKVARDTQRGLFDVLGKQKTGA
jgi:uncharacterized protein YprB with RNaseH-like and TPR domain